MNRVCFLVIASIFVGISCLVLSGSAISLPCSRLHEFPPLWLNSSTQVSKIVGNQFTAYARKPDGTPYLDTWQRVELYEIQELALVPSISNPNKLKCATGIKTPDGASSVLLRALEAFTDTCTCTQTYGTRMFQSGISEQFVTLEVTRNDWPGFKLSASFTLVNETYTTIVPRSPQTFNMTFPMTWSSHAPKISFQVSQWNWTSPGVANSSLRLYFFQSLAAEEDSVFTVTDRNPLTIFTSSTTNAFIESTFLTAFRADDVDYVIQEVQNVSVNYTLTQNQPELIPFTLNICHDYQPPNMTYSDLFYDPSIVALFTGPIDNPSSNPDSTDNNKKNKPLNPAAYIVPVVLVGLLIITLIALVIFIPSVRHFFKPFTNPQDRSSVGHTTESSQSRPQTGGNNWARASTPASP